MVGGWQEELLLRGRMQLGRAAAARCWRVRVEEHGGDDEQGAHDEHEVDDRVEKVHGEYARDDDGQRGGEALQYVVGVLDDDGDEQAAGTLYEDVEPDECVVAEEEALGGHVLVLVGDDRDEREYGAEHAELDVAHPDGHLRVLQYLLEEDARQAAQHARHDHAEEAEEGVLVGVGGVLGRAGVLYLNDRHAHAQQEERYPLEYAQAAVEHEHHEDGRGQNLELKGDLEDGRVQIRDGQVDKIGLDGEEERRHARLDRVELVVDDLLVEARLELAEVERLGVEQEEREDHLDGLLAHDGRRREEQIAGHGAHVAQQDDGRRVLDDQYDQTGPLQIIGYICAKNR